MKILDGGRNSNRQHLGLGNLAKELMKASVKYSKEREQFGKPNFPEFFSGNKPFKIADMATEIESKQSLLDYHSADLRK